MKLIIFFILILQPILISAQEIRYINESGFEVKKDVAEYSQEIFWDSIQSSSVLIKKHKISGELVEIGYFDMTNIKLKNGIIKGYYKNGNINYSETYKDNKLNGELIGYFETGEIRRKDFYQNNSLINGKCFTLNGADTVYYPMIILPTFKGLHHFDVRYFIAKKLRYPNEAQMKGIQGDVYVSFCIDKNGDFCDTKIVYTDNELLNKESIRVLKKSSKYWKPGYVEGKLAKISFVIPIKYRLD